MTVRQIRLIIDNLETLSEDEQKNIKGGGRGRGRGRGNGNRNNNGQGNEQNDDYDPGCPPDLDL